MPPLSVLMKPASGLCNLRCDYCFYCDEASKRARRSYGFMTEETLKNVIRKTMPHAEGSVTYAFQGGEPTLRGLDFFRRAVELERQYNQQGVEVINAFQTNGYLLDEEWCRFFQESGFLVGISLDGTRELHDAHRHALDGTGTFDRVLESIRLLEKHRVDFNILTVVTSQTAQHVEEIYRFYQKQFWHYQQYIACLDPLDEPHGNGAYALTPALYGQFLIRLFRLWYEDWKRGRQPYIRQFENYIAILLGCPPEACDQGGVCSVQTVVEADGSAYPCDFYMLDEYRLGDLNSERLSQLDERRERSGFIQRSKRLSDACRACRYHFLCRGGCQRCRDPIGGGLYENYFCPSYKAFFDNCLPALEEIAAHVAAQRKPGKMRR